MEPKMRIFLLCFYWIGVGQTHPSGQERHQILTNPQCDCDIPLQTKIWDAYIIAKLSLALKNDWEFPRFRLPENRYNVDAFYEVRMFSESTQHTQALNDAEHLFEEVTRVLQTKFNITQLPSQECLEKTLMAYAVNECNKLFTRNCDIVDKYRSYDGSCNNLEHPAWGMTSSCFERLLPPVYSDGISKLRKAASGNDLPNPRKLSVQLHNDKDDPDDAIAFSFMKFGQFLAHNMMASPYAIKRHALADCCRNITKDPECVPISIDDDDPFYPALGITCLNALRTAACPSCKLGPRNQANEASSFIDASVIYGWTKEQTDELRNMDDTGTLKSRYFEGCGELLPSSFDPSTDGCSFQAKAPNKKCFQAGDPRANMHNGLTVLHNIFLRQHNKIARTLKTICGYDEERNFQETRRIVIAQLQVITFGEYLPILLGPARSASLYMQQDLSYTKYDPMVNPSMIDSFAGAAFRFAHSQIFGGETTKAGDYDSLAENYNYPFDIYKGAVDVTVSLDLNTPCQKVNRHVTAHVTNYLSKLRDQKAGLDLVMLDIFRGRDHGIPPYVQMLKFCGGPDVTSFDQLNPIFHEGYVKLFQESYESVEDIDFFSGGLAEKPTNGAIVGPTFACIIEIQFIRTKFGDRFYFEHGQQAGSFTPAQLREIKKTSFSKILCDNSDVKSLQKNAFLLPNIRNPNLSCSDLPDLNLSVFRF